jgi:hypothetical protein
MENFIRKRWFLLLVLVIFIICKIHHLYYAFYWDECWPYAKGVNEMFKNGVSLLPGAIDGTISRGHPLFFHAAAATWMHIFGTSHVSMHSFALFISILVIISMHEIGLKLFSSNVAMLSVILITTEVMFFVQSSFLLFEILVGLLAFVSIYFYVKRKYFLSTICLTALFLTKESGMVAGLVIGMDALIRLFNRKEEIRVRLQRFIPVTTALVSIILFFLYQKQISGWYVLPLYTQTLITRWNDYYYVFKYGTIAITFFNSNNYHAFLIVAIMAVFAVIKSRKIKYVIVLITALLVYMLADIKFYHLMTPGVHYFILFIILFTASIVIVSRSVVFPNYEQKHFILLCGFFVLCFICFSTEAFLIARYMLAAIIPLLFLFAVFIDLFLVLSYKWLIYPVVFAMLTLGYLDFKYDAGHEDVHLDAFKALEVQQDIVDYMERSNFYDKYVSAGSFLTIEHLTDPETGFLQGSNHFKKVVREINDSTQLIITDNIESWFNRDKILSNTSFKLVYKIDYGEVWAEIYERK